MLFGLTLVVLMISSAPIAASPMTFEQVMTLQNQGCRPLRTLFKAIDSPEQALEPTECKSIRRGIKGSRSTDPPRTLSCLFSEIFSNNTLHIIAIVLGMDQARRNACRLRRAVPWKKLFGYSKKPLTSEQQLSE
jgi:hypothetical protein